MAQQTQAARAAEAWTRGWRGSRRSRRSPRRRSPTSFGRGPGSATTGGRSTSGGPRRRSSRSTAAACRTRRGARDVARGRSVHRASRGRDRVRAAGGRGRHQRPPRARAGRPRAIRPRCRPPSSRPSPTPSVPAGEPADWTHALMDVGAARLPAADAALRRLPGAPWCRYAAGVRPSPRRRRRAGDATGGSPPSRRRPAGSAAGSSSGHATRRRRLGRVRRPDRRARSARRPRGGRGAGPRGLLDVRETPAGLRRACPPDAARSRCRYPSPRADRDPSPCPPTTPSSALDARRARAALGGRRHAGRRSPRETMTGPRPQGAGGRDPGRDADGAGRHGRRRRGRTPWPSENDRWDRPGADPAPGRATTAATGSSPRAGSRGWGIPSIVGPRRRRGAARDPRRGAQLEAPRRASPASRKIHAPGRARRRILGQGIEKAGDRGRCPARHRRPRPAPRARSGGGRASSTGPATAGVPVLAVDTPTAVDLTSGDPSDPVARADLTVTFHRPKTGLAHASARRSRAGSSSRRSASRRRSTVADVRQPGLREVLLVAAAVVAIVLVAAGVTALLPTRGPGGRVPHAAADPGPHRRHGARAVAHPARRPGPDDGRHDRAAARRATATPLDARGRPRAPGRRAWDLLIVGGGIVGAGAFLDAASVACGSRWSSRTTSRRAPRRARAA